ncbi:MAG: hypothetical protein KDE33_18545, partial [Bacteroidetes bacterium]|nr:hypothetical protein [Bacteroidota bacterium]
MKKVLILSYYFPPCNLTAANRIGGWYKYLPENNFYPIVITRNWTGNELTEESRLMDSGKEIRVEKKEDSEVHYLPYKASWRDNCFVKGKNNKFFALVSKLLTTLMTVLQNFTIKAIPYNNLYYYIQNFLKENKDVKTLIISGNPFEQFYFGYLLKKEFPDLKWVADYRDDWTTNELYKKNSPLYKVINRYNRHFELKWLKSSSKIITVSNLYASRLAK